MIIYQWTIMKIKLFVDVGLMKVYTML